MLNRIVILFLLSSSFVLFANSWEFSSVNLVNESGKITLSGRVKGTECKRLRITAKIEYESGAKNTMIGDVESVESGGSRIFSISESSFYKTGNWKLLDIKGQCR
ncbi:hypothetical protein CH379_007620 [Leptospira ellisii]|nr:hypothetical protein [Leptospira ellisii]MDV6235491.1 hypothetical protein [Leptospira ellisii]